MAKRLKIVIYGQVQGVSFRYAILQLAERLSLTGWVKNEIDGSVTALFEGEEKAVAKVLGFCHHGPSTASVTQISVEELPGPPQYGDFQIL